MTFTSFKKIAESNRHILSMTHVASNANVKFPAFLTNFSDDYSVQWGNDQIYGRNDPVKPYGSTSRTLNVGFEVLAATLAEARKNMESVSRLAQMMYPAYSKPLSGTGFSFGRTIKAPPLLRIKFANLIQSQAGMGLLGCIEGFSFNPNREAGFFTPGEEIYPKIFQIDFRFTPQHEETLGWDESSRSFLASSFPYNINQSSLQSSAVGGRTRLDSDDNSLDP